MAYDNLQKFIKKKKIKVDKSTEKQTYKDSKKGKTLTSAESKALTEMIAKDLGYL